MHRRQQGTSRPSQSQVTISTPLPGSPGEEEVVVSRLAPEHPTKFCSNGGKVKEVERHMAITRRQFVATLGSLAAAMGIGQSDLTKLTEAFAYGNPGAPWAAGKPKVIWVHGAECTGCSTSLLGLFENLSGRAIEAVDTAGTLGSVTGVTTLAAAGLAISPTAAPRTLANNGAGFDPQAATTLNIADVVVDFLDIQYHETIMGPGGDMAYNILKDNIAAAGGDFVLVVEGAVQVSDEGGYWQKATGDAPWCSIAMDGTNGANVELTFDEVVSGLAAKAAAIVAIGQCATFGGYPACVGGLTPLPKPATGVYTNKQTPAYGVEAFLKHIHQDADAAKVINVPGCPTNPWWFVLTVVAWLIDANAIFGGAANGPLGILSGAGLSINAGAVDSTRRLKAVYGSLNHGKYCPRYTYYAQRIYASKPGEAGCLKNIGCKGLATMSLCTRHGWNGGQPQNLVGTPLGSVAEGLIKTTAAGNKCGGNCITAGAPCMGCTEKGYPDAFVPFVSQR